MNFKHHDHCKQCDRYVNEEAKSDCTICGGKDTPSNPAIGSIVGAVVTLALIGLLYVVFSGGLGWLKSPSSSTSAATRDMSMGPLTTAGSIFRDKARDVILEYLKAPSTAEFQNGLDIKVTKQGSDLYLFTGHVDAENSFGAKIREQWKVMFWIGPGANGEWPYKLKYAELSGEILVDHR